MTAREVFVRAMHLSDNTDENGSDAFTNSDNKEYRNRTLAIINMLQNELYPYSDTYKTEAGKRPVLEMLTDFETDIGLDDFCAGTVLVYGLAARLFTDENGNIASFYEQEYERLLNQLKSGYGMQSGAEMIEDAYGSGYTDEFGVYHAFYPYNEFGRW